MMQDLATAAQGGRLRAALSPCATIKGTGWKIAGGYVWRESLFGWRRAMKCELVVVLLQALRDQRDGRLEFPDPTQGAARPPRPASRSEVAEARKE